MKRILAAAAALTIYLTTSAQETGKLEIIQTDRFAEAFAAYVQSNADRHVMGYRIRIYFDNVRQSRAISENIASEFAAEYPDIPVYRSYSSPFFKVTVGDFRTKDDAQQFANRLVNRYPSVFLVREAINYPAL